MSDPPLNPDWSDKGRQIAALFTPYGDREYQDDLLYRTRLHGEDGISFFFDEGYTYIPWNGLAFLLDAMIEDGDYPNPVVEEQPDPIGDYNIPDEVDEMGDPHRQMTIGEADFDYVLDSVAYEAGETVVEPVKPQAIVQMENDTPAAGDEPASVPDENPHAIVEAPETALPTDTAEQPAPPPVKGNTTAHKNFRRFQELFPEIVSGQYEYLRLEAGEAYYPLVIHHKYGSHYCMEHYYMQNGDRMYDPYMDFQIDKEAGTLRAFSYENSGIGVYNEADPDDPAYEKAINGFNKFFATWLNNIRSQGYEPVRASMMVNDEEVDVDLRPAAEAIPVVEEEQPEQLSLLSLEKSTEDLLVERVMQKGPLTAGEKEQIYEFAQTHPTGSEFTAFLKKLYGYEGFSGDEMGVKYAMFNSEGVTIEWQDKQGETQETKLSWARAAGVVQRLVDEGRYLETPVVSLPEPETDEPLEGETEPYDYSFEYGLLGRLKADCEYFLSEGHQHKKHLWAGSIHAQIAKMRELYDLLPEKPEGITKEIIDDYETRMAPWEHDEAEETQILDEALDAHHGQIDTQREKAPEPDEIIPYRWNARNIRIAVAGSQRRSGVTVTAFNLASWLAARGAEVAYIEVNQNRHLQLLLNIYEAAPDGEHYTIDGIDCYLTNEPDKAYQFIIYDCGVMQTPTSIFRDADHRLLCGSVLPYEIPVFHKALSECGSLEVRPVAICVPQEIQEYCMELFGENVQIAAASHDLFAKRVNGQIYRPLVEKYIAGEKRL